MPYVKLGIWWRALRAYSFTATLIPVLCGFLFAEAAGWVVGWSLLPLMLYAALLLHAGTNLLNDYYDFILGFDKPGEAHGSSGLLTAGLVKPDYMFKRGRIYIIAGASAGLLLVLVRGWPLLLPAALGVAGAWFYSHRAGYKYKGLGEPFVFLLMGPVLFFASVYTACGTLPARTVWPAAACGCWVTAILLINNLRDLNMDRSAGLITLPMRLGGRHTKELYTALIVFAFLAPAVLFAAGFRSTVLLPVLALPSAIRHLRRVWRSEAGTDLIAGPKQTALLYLLYGLLLAIGLFLSR
jgi:1,4-dihydroxy-2-naphthoate polyprenyltransferase